MKQVKNTGKILLLVLAMVLGMLAAPMPAQAAKKVKLNKTSLTLKVDEWAQLKLLNAPKKKAVKWSSSGKTVASVDQDGWVCGKKPGKTKIKASVGGKKYYCVVTVKKEKAQSGKDEPGKDKPGDAGSEKDASGKNKSDLAALKKVVEEQQKRGAFVSDLYDDPGQYTWNEDGRLIGINWSSGLTYMGLNGDISLSGLPELQWFRCSENADLTGLDMSGCKALTDLDCMMCHLTSLNLSGCESLNNLMCENNQLAGLNLKDCTKLTYLSCDDNPLGSLDLSGCKNLEVLYCRRAELTSLDVSKCTKLKDLTCLDNKLTSLDVSNCIKLKSLDCTDNPLTSLDLSKNKKLKDLSCDDSVVVTK